jgi:hypothetical protein
MGLTIHYNGRFNPKSSLQAMIDEVKDICEISNWKYTIFENEFPNHIESTKDYDGNLYGIIFSPPNCEPVSLAFLSNRRLSSPLHLAAWDDNANVKAEDYLYKVFTKTQFAGPEIHKIIIHFLKYITKKYFQEFECFDESQYWETEDEHKLIQAFNRYNKILDSFGSALQQQPMNDGESFEAYLKRLFNKLSDRFKDDDDFK